MSFLLDTCTFLWYISADARLPPGLRDSIRSPDRDVWFSVVSFWEILVKHELGKLPLPESPATYIPKQRERHGFHSLPLDEAMVGLLAKLPALHRDPFDRMLVCQAIEHGLAILTPDSVIHAYPVKTLWAT